MQETLACMEGGCGAVDDLKINEELHSSCCGTRWMWQLERVKGHMIDKVSMNDVQG